MLPLGTEEAHLWYTFPDQLTDPNLLGAYDGLMTPAERRRQQRCVFPAGRHEYLVTRALVRTTLSRYVDVDPRDWRFAPNKHGRPEIVQPVPALPLRFNLSHTSGLIACLVSLDREVGVDVENVDQSRQTLEIAERFFAPGEVKELRSLPAGAQRGRFFQYWTLKESYIKARGMGLAIPLEQFAFHLDRADSIRISFDPRLPDDPYSWQFALHKITPRHLLALALRRSPAVQVNVTLQHTVPLEPVQS